MGQPTSNDNYRGYDNANVSTKTASFKNKKFLLIHSTADASVHFQHSAHLLKALTAAGVDYRVQLYPDQPHAVIDVLSSSNNVAADQDSRPPVDPASMSVRRHVLRTMQNFILTRCRKSSVEKTSSQTDDVDDEQTVETNTE